MQKKTYTPLTVIAGICYNMGIFNGVKGFVVKPPQWRTPKGMLDMKWELFYSRANRSLNSLVAKAVDMCSSDASKLTTGMGDDKPIVIRYGGRKQKWESRYLAYHYYYTGAISCNGSESDRYMSIAASLLSGADEPSDEEID